jgi:alpha-N-arabinofuranosidase
MTTTNTNTKQDGRRFGNCIVHTQDIRSGWSDPVYVDQGGIDPSLLFDCGKVWFCSNGGAEGQNERGIYLCEIDPITGKKRSPSRLISKGTGPKCTEAPHLYHINGWYYLVLAEGGTEYGHMVTVQRSRNIEGPYEDCPYNPVLSHRYRHRYPVQAVGHADLFEDHNGNWWMACLGIRIIDTQELHHLGRETFLVPVRWEQDWLLAGTNGALELEMEGPLPEAPYTDCLDVEADFSAPALPPCWNYIRNPNPSLYVLKKGRLFLSGGKETLSGLYPTFTGVKQQSFTIEAAASISQYAPPGTRAGLTAFYNESYHYEVAVEWEEQGLAILVNRRIHDMEAVTFKSPLNAAAKDIELRITSDPQWYYFSYRLPNGLWRDCGKAMTAGLCSEGTWYKTFTGVYIGLFSNGGAANFSAFTLKNL